MDQETWSIISRISRTPVDFDTKQNPMSAEEKVQKELQETNPKD